MIHTLTAELVISAPLITAGHSPLAKTISSDRAPSKVHRVFGRPMAIHRRVKLCDNDALTALHQAGPGYLAAPLATGHQVRLCYRDLMHQQRLDNEAFAKGKDLAKIYPGAVYPSLPRAASANSGNPPQFSATAPQLGLCWRADTLIKQSKRAADQGRAGTGVAG